MYLHAVNHIPRLLPSTPPPKGRGPSVGFLVLLGGAVWDRRRRGGWVARLASTWLNSSAVQEVILVGEGAGPLVLLGWWWPPRGPAARGACRAGPGVPGGVGWGASAPLPVSPGFSPGPGRWGLAGGRALPQGYLDDSF